MTPELLQRITREAEEKYPIWSTPETIVGNVLFPGAADLNTKAREAHIAAATAWAEKMEAIRAEVEKRELETLSAAASMHLKEILSLVENIQK